MFSNSWFTIWNKYSMSSCVKYKLVSCANIIGSNMFEAFFKSFTYKINRGGPKTEPCGTPQLIVSILVFLFSLIWMNCLLFERQLSTHPWFLFVIPYISNFLRKMDWSTVSTAFDRSMNIPSVYLLFSKDSIIWSTNCTTVWSVEWQFWPNCLECKILFSFQYFYKRLYILPSSILEKHGSTGIGL